jgi:hypothetical protein
MAEISTKAELLATMQHGYTTFEAFLAPLNAELMTTPNVSGDWSIKDILVHLATWQRRAAQILEAAQHNEKPRLNPPVKTDEEMNQFNDATFAANRARSLPDVQQDFRAAYQELVVSVEALSEEDLFEPGRFAWMQGNALWENVEGNSFGHYDEHVAVIKAWLA